MRFAAGDGDASAPLSKGATSPRASISRDAEHVEQLFRLGRHEGLQEDGRHAEGLGAEEERAVYGRGRSRREPGRELLHVAVGFGQGVKDRRECSVDLEGREVLLKDV